MAAKCRMNFRFCFPLRRVTGAIPPSARRAGKSRRVSEARASSSLVINSSIVRAHVTRCSWTSLKRGTRRRRCAVAAAMVASDTTIDGVRQTGPPDRPSLKGDFVGQSRLRKAAEEPPQIPARVFNLAEVRNLREKPAPTLLLDLELRQLLQKLQLFPFQCVLCGVHAGPPKQKLSSSCPPETPL